MESAFRDTAGVKLIETLGWDGAAFGRLDLHLARMDASARAFGWEFSPGAAAASLRSGAPAGQAARMRMTLDAAGVIDVTSAPLPEVRPVWRLGLAQVRLNSGDPWLGVKSTRRAVYDAARAALSGGLDELIFLNERGEVCEGTITNLFFDAGSGLSTPPLRCGLLPGVLRAEMLAQGQCREAILAGDALAEVKLWVGNSLRGLMPAQWVG